MEGISIERPTFSLARELGVGQQAGAGSSTHSSKLREAATDFEALVYSLMVREMRQTVGGQGLFGEGAGRAVYEGMWDTMLSQEMARAGQLGIADSLLRSQLLSEAVPDEETVERLESITRKDFSNSVLRADGTDSRSSRANGVR